MSLPHYGKFRPTSGSIPAADIQLFDKSGNLVAPVQSPGMLLTATVPIANAAVLTLFSVGAAIVAAPAAGSYLDVESMILLNIYKTAAYANGGAIQLNYAAAAVTLPATATVAATFLTSPVANQMIKVAGSLATQLSSSVMAAGLWLTAATADFITGAGSLVCIVKYRIVPGLS
jgi:hypothetical protein